jgi:ferric enterobactin receptor
MRYLVMLLVLFWIGSGAYGQQPISKSQPNGKIIGRVVDSLSGLGVEDATLTLFRSGQPRPTNGAIADNKGKFSLDGLEPGVYSLKIEFIGFAPRTMARVEISDKMTLVNLGDILLSKKTVALQSVTVTANAGLVDYKIDKMVYNVEKDVTSQGGVATDVLKKIPMVSVDVDGNVELQGSSDIRFLINGKPSSVFGNNLVDALQSIPASQIKSIEVITSPGAKYDAEGTGGIINIILKESKVKGINGSVSLSAGTRLENGSFNLNARSGKISANIFFSGNAQLPSTTLNSLNRQSYDSAGLVTTDLTQNGNSSLRRSGYQTGLGLNWALGQGKDLTASFGFSSFGNNNQGFYNQQLTSFDSLNNVVSTAGLVNDFNSNFRSQSKDWSLGYKRKFPKEDQSLDLLYAGSYGNNHAYYSQDQYSLVNDTFYSGSYSNNRGTDFENSLQLDYAQPFSDQVKLETGLKADIHQITSQTDAYASPTAPPSYQYDSALSNQLDYRMDVYAAYASMAFPAFHFLDIQAGLRYERTQTKANFFNGENIAIPAYNTLAPSVILSHTFDNDQTIKVTYSKRINRPGYRELNPYINASDPKNITTGNPYLLPEIGIKYELAYVKSFKKGGVLNIVAFYRRNVQDIQPYVTYYPTYQVGDSVYTDVAVGTFQNIGAENNYGLNVYGSVPFTSKFTVRTNLAFFQRYIVNTIPPGSTITSFNYRIQLNLTYEFTKTFVAEAFGRFNSPRNEVQGRYPSFTSYSLAFRKLIWKSKASIGFTCTNPFNEYVNQPTAITGPGFVINSDRKIPYRSFGITLMYKFGKLTFKEDKQQNKELPTPDEGN